MTNFPEKSFVGKYNYVSLKLEVFYFVIIKGTGDK